jgi:proteasome lid subunit RPN8/RPN11
MAARLPRALADAIAAHARAEAPLESCGLVIGSAAPSAGGIALRFVACRNRLASRYRYEVHPDDLVRAVMAADDAGEVLWGIVHSHVATPAIPSRTDIGLATWPDALQLVVSLAGDEPVLEGWRIADGEALAVGLEIG